MDLFPDSSSKCCDKGPVRSLDVCIQIVIVTSNTNYKQGGPRSRDDILPFTEGATLISTAFGNIEP